MKDFSPDALHRVRSGAAREGWKAVGDRAVALGLLSRAELQSLLEGGALLPDAFLSSGLLTSAQLERLCADEQISSLASSRRDPLPVPPEAAAVQDDPDRRFDGYVLTSLIGKGGFGEVWKAWDLDLSRWVAVKVLQVESPAAADRFLREASLAARIVHEGVVPVHAVGMNRGRPFFVMRFVEGGAVAFGPDQLRRSVEAVRDAARAIQAAHEMGIVHLDLKPSNLLVGPGGKIQVVDFGLAREFRSGSGDAVSSTIIGTPAYMSPQQARGDPAGRSPASDIFSLGAALFHLAVGRPPYVGRTHGDVLLAAVAAAVPRPRSINPKLPSEVETILLKCMDPDPARRYPTALAVAEDLDRYLSGLPILARPESIFRRAARWVRRNRPWVAAAVLVAAMLIPLLRRRDAPPSAPAPKGPIWTELGGSATGDGFAPGPSPSWYPALSMDRSGHPVVAWQDGAGVRSSIRLSRWNGSSWEEPGNGSAISLEPAEIGHPSLALDSQERPVVAWHDGRSGNFEIYVRRWSGTTWEEFAGSASGGGISRSPEASTRPWVALDRDDRPIVAWCDRLTRDSFLLRLSRWDGKAWMPLADLSRFASRQLPSPILGVDPSNRLLLAWRSSQEGSTSFRVHRLESGGWRELEGLVPGSDLSGEAWERIHAAMVLDSAGHPVVAYGSREQPTPQVRVRRWSGTEWRSVGDVLEGGAGDAVTPAMPALGLDPAGEPVIGWTYGRKEQRILHLCRWKENRWANLGTFELDGPPPSLTYTTPFRAALALDVRGTIGLAAVDKSKGVWKVHVRRLAP